MKKRKAKTTTQTTERTHLDEAEYRFDLVDEAAWENCVNWELHREEYRKKGEKPPRPWKNLTSAKKRAFRAECFADLLAKHPPIYPVPPASGWGANHFDEGGRTLISVQFFRFNQIVRIDWEKRDTEMIEEFKQLFGRWLQMQRNSNPNARHFNERPKKNHTKTALHWLLRLAVWRLHKRGGFTGPEIEKKLSSLFALARFGGLNRNMNRWCREIDDLFQIVPMRTTKVNYSGIFEVIEEMDFTP